MKSPQEIVAGADARRRATPGGRRLFAEYAAQPGEVCVALPLAELAAVVQVLDGTDPDRIDQPAVDRAIVKLQRAGRTGRELAAIRDGIGTPEKGGQLALAQGTADA